MSIKLTMETPDFYENLRCYEKCVFCGAETKHWHTPTNAPICPKCGETRSVSEIAEAKTKAEKEAFND